MEIIKNEKTAERSILTSFLTILNKNNNKIEALSSALYEIICVDWLPITPKGGIFLVDPKNHQQLRLSTTTSNFSSELLTLCDKIDFGHCICGRAAGSKKIVFVDCIDDCHDVRFENMTPHGHYSVPFLDTQNNILGVLVLYVDHGHQSNNSELSFLKLVSYGLGTICERFDTQEKYIKQKDDLLRQKELLDHAVLISETNLDGVITYVNHKFCEISMYTTEDLIGKTYKAINSGEHSKEFWNDCWQAINAGHFWKGECCNRNKNGDLYWVEGTILPIINNAKEITGFTAIQVDITAKKQTKLKQIEHNQKLSFLGKIATEIGHEINTPLGIIQMNAGLMRRRLLKMEGVDEKVFKGIDSIESTVTRMSSIVDGLKIIGRSSENKVMPIDAHESIIIIVDLISGIYEIDEIKLNIQSTAKDYIFQGDHGKFHQVITNLISNARDALLEIDDRQRIINISLLNEMNNLIILISDNAGGIDEENLKHIFKENFTTKEIGKGTGIGLSISGSILKSMNGEISVQSQIGKGTTFKIALPVFTNENNLCHSTLDHLKTTSLDEDYFSSLSGRILVVDDNQEMRKLLCATINDFGCETKEACNGQEALTKLKENHFDILLTDLRMPLLTGEELLNEVKKLEITDLKIITLSGDIAPFTLKENQIIIKEMVDTYLAKPITRKAIYDALSHLLVPVKKAKKA